MFSWYRFQIFLKLLVTVPVAPIITGVIVHFRFHIRCISIHKLLYFNFFSASFCTTFLSAGIATSISLHVFSFLFLIIISGLFAETSLCVLLDSTTLWHLPLHTLAWTCVYHVYHLLLLLLLFLVSLSMCVTSFLNDAYRISVVHHYEIIQWKRLWLKIALVILWSLTFPITWLLSIKYRLQNYRIRSYQRRLETSIYQWGNERNIKRNPWNIGK